MVQQVIGDAERRVLTAFAEAMPGPVLVVDLAMRLVAGNAAARNLMPSLKTGDPLPMGIRSPEVLDAVRRVCGGGPAETTQWVERVPVERMFEVSVAPVPLDTAGAVAIAVRDLTEARRIERMRADFIANASHELRTPLASLLGFIETLQGPARNDEAARLQFLGIMRDQAQRMSRLIEDLLSLSRIEQTQHLRPQGLVDLALVARHVADTLSPLAEETGARVTMEAPDGAVVVGDRDEIIRLAENLIENAIKYGGREGGAPEVRVEVLRSAGEIMLRVSDNGPGIAPEHIPRLTERFFRAESSAGRARGGTGLGLAIVKHILARHRGRLTIKSKLGEGSTFSASLPDA